MLIVILVPLSHYQTKDGIPIPTIRTETVKALEPIIGQLETLESIDLSKPYIIVPAEHERLMLAGGVPQDQLMAAEVLISRESDWNASAVNNSSGSCSLVQALPCSKIPGNWRDPITAIKWGNQYVKDRYGDWWTALNHSYNFNWY